MARTVFCQYEQRDTEGLDFVPYPGELGQRIFNGIGKSAWSAWLRSRMYCAITAASLRRDRGTRMVSWTGGVGLCVLIWLPRRVRCTMCVVR